VSDAARAWINLSSPWRAAFDEAWMSWRQGSLGVGAAIADDGDQIIARGHNQFFHAGPGPISSTYMAHAEMNALAQLPVGRGQRYSIYSSFEPCYMCTSALLFYRIERVAFASVDPVWLGMHEWFQSAPWASRNHLTRECLGGELGAFGYVLHISRLAEIAPTHVLETHQQETSQLFDFATSSVVCDLLTGVAATNEPATTDSVLANLWKDLVRMGT
jgi:tRNA(Arg) A34 adenosine deaminase TadA